MKRKLLSAILCVSMVATMLVGCGSKAETATTDTAATEAPATEEAATDAAETTDAAPAASAVTTTSVTADGYTIPITGIGTQVATDLKAAKEYKIGYISKNTTNPYMVAQANGVTYAGEQMGFTAVTQAPATADSVEEQVKLMEDMIQQGMDCIIVHCADSNGIMTGVKEAKDANIPVITIGTPAAEPTFLRTGVNYKETGTVVAKEIAEALGGKGKVIILEGPTGAANAIERLEGLNEAFAEYPDIEIVASQTANFKRTEGMSVTENLLQKYGDVNAIIGCNDESALGAVQALKAANKTDVLVAGFDGSTDATAAIQSGDMYCSYNTDPYGSGFVACAFAVQYLNDGTEPENAFVPFPTSTNDPLITPDSVSDYADNIAWWKSIQQ